MLVTGGRYGQEHSSRLVAGVGDAVRHARRDEDECSGPRADQLAAYLPLAFALQQIEGFFVDTMNVETGGRAGRQRTVEHGRIPRLLSSHEESHRLAGQRAHFLALPWHSNDRFCAHHHFSMGRRKRGHDVAPGLTITFLLRVALRGASNELESEVAI